MKDKKCKIKECKNLINSRYSKSGLCGKCSRKEYQKKHQAEAKEYSKRYWKESHKRYPEKNKIEQRIYYKKNREQVKKDNQKHYYKNRERYKGYSKNNYEKNKEERAKYNLDYVKRRYKEDLAFKMRRRLGSSLGSVIRYYIKTDKVSNPMPEFGINWKGIIKVLTPIPQPRRDYHVDHIIPLYKFDLSDINEIHIAFAPENHRWLKAKDNLKRNRPGTKWRKIKD